MSDDWRPQEMPTLVIGQIAKLLTRQIEKRLAPFGVTTAQLPVLVSLKNGEKLTQKELAEIAGVEQPSMAQLLGRMERDNLIRREPSPDNWRSSLVMLTDHALALLEPGRDALRALDAEVCASLSAEERATLLRLLYRVAVATKETDS